MAENKRKKAQINTDIDFEIRSPVVKRVFSLLLILLFLFVCGYQVFVMVKNRETLTTETALKRTVSKSITTQCYIVRQEELLSDVGSGTVVPDFPNGSNVAVNDRVARVFLSEEDAHKATSYSQAKQLIDYYEGIAGLSSANLVAGIQVYTSAVTDRQIDIQKDIANGNLSALSADVTALSESITKRQIAVGTPVDVSNKLQELYELENTLSSSTGRYEEIYTHSAGYYVNACDGYEGNYTFSSADAVTKEDVEALLASSPEQTKSSVGKIITSFNWYLLCNISADCADDLTVGNTVNISVDELGGSVLNLRLKAKNRDADNQTVTLVFAGNLMNEEIASLRKSGIKIRTNEISGYALNKKALRTVDGETGVYVQLGNIVRFRKVNVVYNEDGLILASADENESGYLRLYDEIITEGTDLYDGKIIG